MAYDYEFEPEQARTFGLPYNPQGQYEIDPELFQGGKVSPDMLKRLGGGGSSTVLGRKVKGKPAAPALAPQSSHTPPGQATPFPPGAGWRAKSPGDPDAAAYPSYQFYNPQSGSYGHEYINPQTGKKDYMFSDWGGTGINEAYLGKGGGKAPKRSGGGGGGRSAGPAQGGPPALAPPGPMVGGGGGGGGSYTDTFSYNRPQNPWDTPEGQKYRENINDMISTLMSRLEITPSMGLRSNEKHLFAQTIPARMAAAQQLAQLLGAAFTNKGAFDLSASKEGTDAAQANFNTEMMNRYYTGQNLNAAQKNAIDLETLRNVTVPLSQAQAAHYGTSGAAQMLQAQADWQRAKFGDPGMKEYYKALYGTGSSKTSPYDTNRAKIAAEYANDPAALSQALSNYDNVMAGKTYVPPTSGALGKKGTTGGWRENQPPEPGAQYNPQDGFWYVVRNGQWNRIRP